ncbi:MAG: hypothetical protein DMF61_14600 [Blastocatellia bacterium AA13]|nr:MAG: hypothetical protein DMF61_14600 [Blastocatellia bacterium AA13]
MNQAEPLDSRTGSDRPRPAWVWLAFAAALTVYAFQFVYEGGRQFISTDGNLYLALSRGEAVSVPINTRIVKPYAAAAIVSLTKLDAADVFRLLTSIEIPAALLVLFVILRRRNSSSEWQAFTIAAVGIPAAATFGHTPVLVDSTLLLLTVLTIAALDRGKLALGLIFACLAALTKEYGLWLGFVWMLHAYRRGHRAACLNGLLPAVLLIAVMWTLPGARSGVSGWGGFFQGAIGYQQWIYHQGGAANYPKTLYIWSWSAVWPLLFVAVLSVCAQLRGWRELSADLQDFSIMMTAMPLLLLPDWDRALLLIVPFACVVAAAHPLSRRIRFISVVASGSIATTLARPLYINVAPPRVLIMAMMLASFAASLFVLVMISRFHVRGRIEMLTPAALTAND